MPTPQDHLPPFQEGQRTYPTAGRAAVRGLRGMVASAHPLASSAGAQVLRNGGNAFDAIVATAATLNVCEPSMSGLAGNGMATMYIAKERRVRTLDFTPPVPLKFDADTTTKLELTRGIKGVGVPGNLAGWCAIRDSYGTRPLSELFGEAIGLARNGFPITDFFLFIADYCLKSGYPNGWKSNYLDVLTSRTAGAVLKQPDLADTLEAIGRDGQSRLYGGALGEKIVSSVREAGGVLTMADLDAVAPAFLDPMTITYRGMDIHSCPPSSEAFQFLLTLDILNAADFSSMDFLGADHLDTLYRATRIAAEARINLNGRPREEVEQLFAERHLARFRERLFDGRPIVGRTEQWGDGPLAEANWLKEHTTSFSAADTDGNLICVTQTLGYPFGSGHVVPGTGVCLSNYLDWGDLNPASPNLLRPGQKWSSVVSPSIGMVNGSGVLALGTPGGYGILQSQPQVYVNHLDYGLNLQEAIDAPRTRLQDGSIVQIESRVSKSTIDELRRRGHAVEMIAPLTLLTGGIQAVSRDPATGSFVGAADPRRDGAAIPA